jgi:hypothetical protein
MSDFSLFELIIDSKYVMVLTEEEPVVEVW